jgi:Bacterial Ig-like domain (group 3)
MKGIIRLKRAAAIFGVSAVVVGGAVLGTTQAQAATLGTDVGGVTLSPGSGSTTGTITYNAVACPTGFQGSGLLRLVDPVDNHIVGNLAPINNSVASAFTGTLNAGILQTLASTDANVQGHAAEIAVLCTSAASGQGTTQYFQDTFVTISADGTSYTTGNSSGPQSVTVSLTASPNPATVGQSVTLTAHVTPAGATGTIQFEDNGTNINSAVNISGGVATTSFTPSAVNTAGEALTAVYNPTGAFTASGPGTLSLPINAAAANSGQIPLAVIVPATGTFTLTVDTTDWVVLNVTDPANPVQATASTTPIVVKDTRNTFPGWSVSGQATPFSGTIPASPAGYPAYNPATVAADHGSQTIAADQLGWKPTGPATLPPGVALGSQVAAGTNPNGLGDAAQVLASVHAGTGNGFTGDSGLTLGADLTLAIPSGQEAGPYAGFLNITSVSALP